MSFSHNAPWNKHDRSFSPQGPHLQQEPSRRQQHTSHQSPPPPSRESYPRAQTRHASPNFSFGHDSSNFRARLGSATENELLGAGNIAYLTLLKEKNQLEGALEAQKQFVRELRSEKTQSASTGTMASKQYTQQPAPANFPFDIPELLEEQPSQEDYPDVFWTLESWNKHAERMKDKGRTVSSMDWLTDGGGYVLDEQDLKEMTTVAKDIFNELHFEGFDPTQWHLRHPKVKVYFERVMRNKFPILSLCDGDWKVNMFGSSRFTTWNRHTREKGLLKRRNPSLRSSHSNTLPSKKRKRKALPENDKRIIEIKDSEDERDRVSSGSGRTSSPPPITKRKRTGSPIRPLPKPGAAVAASTSTQSTAAHSSTTSSNAPSTAVSSQEQTNQTPPSVLPPTRTHVSQAQSGTTPGSSDLVGQEENNDNRPSKTSAPTPISMQDQPATAPSLSPKTLAAVEQTQKTSFPDPFAGLRIPPPSFTAPASNVPLAAPAPAMADPAPKKGKVMAPNPTMMTPRSAPVISFEFAQIWRDVLNNKPDITARYEQLSKERKAAPTTSNRA